MTERVLLLHGIWNAKAWLSPLASRLRAAGFDARVWGYASVFGGPEHVLPRLIAHLRDGPQTHLVGHSLGGLVALEALRRAPGLPVRRVVCLGSPLRGSDTARRLAAHRLAGTVLGRSAGMLQRPLDAWGGGVEVGMVAGSVPHGVGRLIGSCDDASDGTVRLEETRLPGLADHCVVAASHSGLVFSAAAAAQAATFLRTGRFAPPG